MRFHKAEAAFFVFITVVLVAGVLSVLTYGNILHTPRVLDEEARLAHLVTMGQLVFATGVLQATALFFGVFFIYPLLRTQLREEDKLRAMTVSLSARSETLEQAALTDALTGTQKRRFFDDALNEYIEAFGRIGRPVGLVVLDLDHFKAVNDTYGHDVGDEVLKAVAKCLLDMTRHHDVVARLGGEEFAIVAPDIDEETLAKLAGRVRKAVMALTVSSDGVTVKVTSSLGIAIWDGRESGPELYRRADRNLYQAKRLGRNRVCA